MARLVGTTHSFDVGQDIETAFRWVVHPDTPVVLVTRWRSLAGFRSYEFISGDWTQPGSSRWITLDDGTRMTETVKTRDEPTYFDYELRDYSLPLLNRSLERAFGQWWFTAREDGGTHVVWKYSFEPKHLWLTPFVWVFTHTAYRAYVKSAVNNMKRISALDGLAITAPEER